jgi:hypothetical protein
MLIIHLKQLFLLLLQELWIRIDFNPDSDTGTEVAFKFNTDPDPLKNLRRNIFQSF